MDKARVIELFNRVVHAGSFSQAAVEAGLSAQAVSKAVRQLEDYLGVRLFHRTTRSLSLTDEGQRLFELAGPGLRLLDEALDHVQNSREAVEGMIRIAASTTLGAMILAPLLREFQELYPGAYFDMLFDDRFTDLTEAKIDIGFRAGNPPERNLVARQLGRIPLYICAAPAYIERHGAPRTVEELLQHRCTGFRQPNTGRVVPWELKGEGGTLYQDVPCVATFNTAEGRLVHLLPKHVTANAAVYMYYPQRSRMPMRVRHFIDFMVKRKWTGFT